MLEIEHVSVSLQGSRILQNISCTVQPGEWWMVIGPNGAGKSTLVNAIVQGVPYTGSITWNAQNLAKMRPATIAQNIGVLMQNQTATYPFSVEEVVRLGRYSHSKFAGNASPQQEEQEITTALAMTGMLDKRSRSLLTLSGGELQRAFLSQVLAQNPKLLLLDEPANHLDLVYQKEIFSLLQNWLQQEGRSIFSVVHDLSLAKQFGTHGILLSKGEIIAGGTIQEILTPQNLQTAYGIDVFSWMNALTEYWHR